MKKIMMYGVFNSEDKVMEKDENGYYGFYHITPLLLTHHKIDAEVLLLDAKKELEVIKKLKDGDIMNPYQHKYDTNLSVKEVHLTMTIQ